MMTCALWTSTVITSSRASLLKNWDRRFTLRPCRRAPMKWLWKLRLRVNGFGQKLTSMGAWLSHRISPCWGPASSLQFRSKQALRQSKPVLRSTARESFLMQLLQISMAANSSFMAGRLQLWAEQIPLYPQVYGGLTMKVAGPAFRYLLTTPHQSPGSTGAWGAAPAVFRISNLCAEFSA